MHHSLIHPCSLEFEFIYCSCRALFASCDLVQMWTITLGLGSMSVSKNPASSPGLSSGAAAPPAADPNSGPTPAHGPAVPTPQISAASAVYVSSPEHPVENSFSISELDFQTWQFLWQGTYLGLPDGAAIRSAFLSNHKEVQTQMGKISFENFTILHQNQVCAVRTTFIQRPHSSTGAAEIPLKQVIQASLSAPPPRERFSAPSAPQTSGPSENVYSPVTYSPPTSPYKPPADSATTAATNPATYNPYADLEKNKAMQPSSMDTPLYSAPAGTPGTQIAPQPQQNPNPSTYPAHAPGIPAGPAGTHHNPPYPATTNPTHGVTPGYNTSAGSNPAALQHAHSGTQSVAPPNPNPSTYPPASVPGATPGYDPTAPTPPAHGPYTGGATSAYNPNPASVPYNNAQTGAAPASPYSNPPPDFVPKPTSDEWKSAQTKLSKKTNSVRMCELCSGA